MNTLHAPDSRRIIVSLGVGTGLLGMTLAALILLATVAIGALHFLPKPSAATNPKAFPRLQSEPLRVPRESIDEAQNIGPLNRGALEEKKAHESDTQAARLTLGNVVGLAALRFPTLTLAAQMVILPQRDHESDKPNANALDEVKGWQSTCPNCPNYRPPSSALRSPEPPPFELYEVPRIQPIYQPAIATPTPSPGGTWFNGPRGPIWLPKGYAYEHDTGYLRNLATGARSVPATPTSTKRPAALEPYRVPRLPEQPPLADDNLGRISPAVPDFTRSPRGERKTGGYACANCKRPTVGDQWATQWTPEGTPISYLCKECWSKMTPEQRYDSYVEWYRRAVE